MRARSATGIRYYTHDKFRTGDGFAAGSFFVHGVGGEGNLTLFQRFSSF